MTSATGDGDPRRDGFTLVEILAVVVIAALLMGIGAGMLLNFGAGRTIAAARAQTAALVGATRAAAIRNGGALLRFDFDRRTVTPVVKETVGLWHGEWSESGGNLIPGAFGRHLSVVNETTVADGKVGGAIRLKDEKDSAACIVSGPFDFTEGMAADCWVWQYEFIDLVDNPADPEFGAARPYAKRQTIVQKGGSFSLSLDEDRHVVAFVSGAVPSETIRSEDPIVAGRWYHLEFQWDGFLRLFINGVEQQDDWLRPGMTAQEMVMNPAPGAPVTVGDERGTSFIGLIDELRVSRITGGGAVYRLPEGVEMEEEITVRNEAQPDESKTLTVTFSGDGELDPRFHAGPVQVNFLVRAGAGIVESLPLIIHTAGTVE